MKHRPFRAPHHSVPPKALVGGGANPMPGEVSLAHRGVLFLDELAEFHRDTLDELRQPLEEGRILISRLGAAYLFPARFMLAGATNPCPCGYYPDRKKCHCTPGQISRYQSRISGPLLDRIELYVSTPPISYEDFSPARKNRSSAELREIVEEIHRIQRERYIDLPGIYFNSQLSNSSLIRKYCPISPECDDFLKQVFRHYELTGRSYHKLLKLSRTIADLDHSSSITMRHISEALQYRPAPSDGKKAF
jgi:magnesium chelatase family protein